MSSITPITPADEGREVLIEGEVIQVREGRTLHARIRDETQTVWVRIFHPTPIHRRYLVQGSEIRLMGRLSRWRGRLHLIHPRIILRQA